MTAMELVSSLISLFLLFVCFFKGDTIKEKDKCSACQGKKVSNERKVLEVVVEKGMREDQKITFRGESDQVFLN